MDDDPRSAYGFLAAWGNGRGPNSEEKGGRREGVGMGVGVDVVVAMSSGWLCRGMRGYGGVLMS
jgi:hypothetical protein